MTKPSKPVHNDGYDNDDYDYILYVNDWLGTDDGHKCVNLSSTLVTSLLTMDVVHLDI